jgi:hypothetical protein
MSYTKKTQKLLKAYLKKHESNAQSNNKKAGNDRSRSQTSENGKARKG